MSCAFLKYVSITTVLLRFTIEIECCSMSINDIIDLIHYKENYQQDPCYIQWQDAQRAQLSGLWNQREQLERSSHEYNLRMRENEAIDRENRRKSYLPDEAKPIQKESGVWKLLGLFVCAIVGVCCCAACIAALQSNDNSTNGSASPQVPQVQLTSVASSDPSGSQTTSANSNNTFSAHPAPNSSPQQDHLVNVPPMPRRQNSLPSYEDAVRMARPQ